MTGHVFVVPGTLDHLACDDLVVSTDDRGAAGVNKKWRTALRWDDAEAEAQRADPVRLSDAKRWVRVRTLVSGDDTGPRRWLLHVASPLEGIDWLVDGLAGLLATIAAQGRAAAPAGRPLRVAVPVIGADRGGFGRRRGKVVERLLAVAEREAAALGIDVVLVAHDESDFAALQALRGAGAGRRLEDDDLERTAAQLALLAQRRQLAIFMGAGTGVAAGLPTWGGLLDAVARELGLDRPARERLPSMNPLDAAELLRRWAAGGAGHAAGGVAEGSDVGRRELGRVVAMQIDQHQRYGLAHVLLAGLGADHALTTNFDALYELAARAVTGEGVDVVLPTGGRAQRGRRWLLKLHGDAGQPTSIVLDRRAFVRYDSSRRPLAGALQGVLLTDHLLVVGASMTDDNVVRLVHEVASLNEEHGRERNLATVLTLVHDDVVARLWRPELTWVPFGPAAPEDEERARTAARMVAAGRSLEVFLDRVLCLATTSDAHLLDRRYADLLGSEQERDLAERLRALAAEVDELGEARPAWSRLAAELRQWGVAGARRRRRP